MMDENNKPESIEQYEKEIAQLVKSAVIMKIIAFICLGIGSALFIVGTILMIRFMDDETMNIYAYFIIEAASVFFSGAVALFIVRAAVFNTRIRSRIYRITYLKQVKDIDNSRPPVNNDPKYSQKDLDLVNEYKKLLDQGYISQEEFDNKKKEILGN